MFVTEDQVRSALNVIVTKCKEVTRQAVSASSFVLSELNSRVQQERMQKDQEHERQFVLMRDCGPVKVSL